MLLLLALKVPQTSSNLRHNECFNSHRPNLREFRHVPPIIQNNSVAFFVNARESQRWGGAFVQSLQRVQHCSDSYLCLPVPWSTRLLNNSFNVSWYSAEVQRPTPALLRIMEVLLNNSKGAMGITWMSSSVALPSMFATYNGNGKTLR